MVQLRELPVKQLSIEHDIAKLAQDKNALILAHNYQPGEIQDIAHVTGDSLELARIASKNDATILVFCGVHFMAESAAILSPEKKVLLPELSAGCPMADMATVEKVEAMKKDYPHAAVVTYINSSAAVKAVSDVICTSSNALRIVENYPSDEIIFIPDVNLGSWVASQTEKTIHLYDGYCPVHNRVTLADVEKVMKEHPRAQVIAHPECKSEVLQAAHNVLSTGQMTDFVRQSTASEIIVATEVGMIHRLKKANSRIEYIEALANFSCEDMKVITPQSIYNALKHEVHPITVDQETAAKAGLALEKMLELS
jgi:quinolinate synthase